MNKWLLTMLILLMTVFLAFADDPVQIDETGTDFVAYWYVGTYGQQIVVDDAGGVHFAYCKTWVAESDTGYQVMYANLDGTKIPVPAQEETDVKPGVIFMDGGHNGTPVYMMYGVGGRFYGYGPSMHLQAMAKLSDDGTAVEPLGLQTEQNYYHNAWYANPFAMQVDNVNGIAHCLLTNPGGQDVGYWNFDGTNFGDIYQMFFADPGSDVPGKAVPGKYRRNATKGADLAVSPDGAEVTIVTLHPFSNVLLHKGTLGGAIWADDWYVGLDEGSVVTIYDTTNSADGTNIPNDDPKPYTEAQVVYDADGNLHVVFDATYMDIWVDTSNWTGNGYDGWWNQYSSIAGDTNAVYYGSGHPKPQLRYWTDITGQNKQLAESKYPLAGEMLKWYDFGEPDSGMGCWGKYLNDGIIANIELISNMDPQDGEPKLVCVWEEMQAPAIAMPDTDWVFCRTYYGYKKDLIASVKMNDLQAWTPANNITNTEDDESDVSVYKDVIDGAIHMMYYQDDTEGSDRNMIYVDETANNYLAYSPVSGHFSVPIRDIGVPQVKIMYQKMTIEQLLTDIQPTSEYTPVAFELNQNYPNPFNPSTSIAYTVPAGKVSMEIFNILGQKVKTLVNKEMRAGSYDIVWNGTDNAGHQVASGVYFYKLKSDAGVKVKKMLFQK